MLGNVDIPNIVQLLVYFFRKLIVGIFIFCILGAAEDQPEQRSCDRTCKK